MWSKRRLNVQKKQRRCYSGCETSGTPSKHRFASANAPSAFWTRLLPKERDTTCALYKASKVRLPKKTECLADSGYQGIRELHKKSRTPLKKPKGGELTVPQKAANKQLARERVLVENVIRHLKIFRILSGQYRNRRRRLMLRVDLIAGFYNYALT